ncbi:MAG: alpha-L-fucosidase, partial [Candidatus Omnitrophica bacterium]|nr:alpha-L-fucosidase [Candidatus Omnitrophota bacterium]
MLRWGRDLGGEEFGKRLKESNVDAVCFFAKCHYGHSYYYTKIGYRHPKLHKDMLKEVAEGCHKYGIGVIAYYSTFVDKHAGIKHPEWCKHDKNENIDTQTFGSTFRSICLNTPYVDELLIPQVREIVQNYDVEGIFFDTMADLTPCHCPHCRKLFKKEIPLSKENS